MTHAISQKHEIQFQHIINDLKVDLNTPQECFEYLSIFEKVALTPGNSKFIELCIQNGSSFFKVCNVIIVPKKFSFKLGSFQKNKNNLYPLYFAIQSMCAENVKTLLQAAAAERKVSMHKNALFLNIVNESFSNGNNHLHNLILKLTRENFENVSKVIEVLVVNGCSMNTPNDQQESPFTCLLAKSKTIPLKSDLFEFLAEKANIDFHSIETEDFSNVLQEISPGYKVEVKKVLIYNFGYMTQLLEDRNERKFIAELDNYRAQTLSKEEFHEGLASFMRISTTRNLCEVLQSLIVHGSDVNYDADKFCPPAFVACMMGHYKALGILLSKSSLKLECKTTKRNLLHEVCKATEIHEPDRQQCFNFIVNDVRCTMEIINGLDKHGKSPLYYACFNGLQKIIMQLLRRGAFIGHQGVLNHVDREIFEEFLDECIKPSNDFRDKNCEIHVDYRFLMPPKLDKTVHSEIDSVFVMSENKDLQKLILHPVVSSFIHLKWRKVNWIAYLNVFAYLCFMIFLGCFIINFFQDPRYQSSLKSVHDQRRQWKQRLDIPVFSESQKKAEIASSKADDVTNFDILQFLARQTTDKPPDKINYKTYRRERLRERIEQHFTENLAAYRFCVIGSAVVTLYELAQCCFSFRKYFFKLSNWLDIVLIFLSFTVLFRNIDLDPGDFKKYQALTILVMSAQTIQSLAKVSIFSMSIHMAIFRKVCITFVKTFSLYLILVLAFAMSFYTLSDDYETESIDPRRRRSVNEDDDEDTHGFSNVFESIITTVRMMLSDFGATSINTQDVFEGSIFLLFIVLITVVLFNLLNALAVSDTVQIMKDAELVDFRKRISILHSYEKLFMFCNITFANLFPGMQSFFLKPRVSRQILMKNRTSVPKDSIVITAVDETESMSKTVSSNSLFQLMFLFNPSQISLISFRTFSERFKNSGYVMGEKNLDKIVNFCRKGRVCRCGSIE